MKKRNTCLPFLFCLLTVSPSVRADVKPASIFGSHMVLQRDLPVKIWGRAEKGEMVTVEFHGQKKSAMPDGDGKWLVVLEKEAAGGPFSLLLKGKNTVVFDDIFVGEVWLCSGQSNMEWPLSEAANAAVEMAAADFPKIRHLKIPLRTSLWPEPDFEKTAWQVCSPTSAGGFSAVAFFFARKLFEETGMAVGLVNASWGGTICETWMSKNALETSPDLREAAQNLPVSLAGFESQYREKMAGLIDGFLKKKPVGERQEGWGELLVPKIWEDQGLPDFDGTVWFRQEFSLSEMQATQPATLFLGTIDDSDTTFLNGQKIGATWSWNRPRRYAVPPGLLKTGKNELTVKVVDTGGGGGFYGDEKAVKLVFSTDSLPLAGVWKARIEQPTHFSLGPNSFATLLFNGMINPLVGFGIRGAIWYQGESNVSRAAEYARTFPAMIEDWRRHWRQGDFPFYFVQLASFLPPEKNSLAGSAWAELRNAQLRTLALPNTGMAVATDIGEANDIHPRNKQDVGRRLALWALKNDFGKNVVESGPIYRSMKKRGRKIELRFDHIGGGLVAKNRYGYLFGFTIAGADGQFHWAKAAIKGKKVIVSSDEVTEPVAVRFGWFDNPEEANLFNREGLPASPFRTDGWKLMTEGVRFSAEKK